MFEKVEEQKYSVSIPTLFCSFILASSSTFDVAHGFTAFCFGGGEEEGPSSASSSSSLGRARIMSGGGMQEAAASNTLWSTDGKS
eukprot:CAMPEP_0185794588 /NCGR_PEP_ID=MMETSP1174-20130828/160094_1 /TAXON_ID=35687 /ORGANISM="Dictyocha speculum, Strain CCMP1381" /LENGTH=84 /DNA_ID=CAMNT_0028489827 /DNA_START=839 /DNA_END=1091 /DNA_ORIENTATION=-